MIGPAAVRRVAGATGFREEAVEKVLYLTAILGRLRMHPELRNAWTLTGGAGRACCGRTQKRLDRLHHHMHNSP